MNILVLDDEREIADLVEVYLKNENYNVFKFYDAKEAINCIESQKLDFAILDVMIKDVDGFKICKMIRDKGLNFPVIMLTAKIEDKDKIQGLTLGADDYITKPFKLNELISRIKAILRRSTQFSKADSVLEANGIKVDTAERLVWKSGVLLELTLVEYKLLCLFMQNPNHLLTREMILDRMWDGNGNYVDDNTLSVYIRRLRSKIEETPNTPKFLLTERGFGYKWVAE